MDRRSFLLALTAGGGAISLRLGKAVVTPAGGEFRPPFLRIEADGSILITSPEVEMGQGTVTGLCQVLAEELDVDWAAVEARLPAHDPVFYDGAGVQSTGDSASMRTWFQPLRQLGATAREMLRQAAANRWGVDVVECRTESGQVIHDSSGRQAAYGELAAAASQLRPPDQPQLKQPANFKLIGRDVPGLDLNAKVSGSAVFGADVRLPGMLYAAVRMPDRPGGRVRRLQQPGGGLPEGVSGVHDLGHSVAVTANSWWRARSFADRLAVEFEYGNPVTIDESDIDAALQVQLDRPDPIAGIDTGNVHATLASAATQYSADYYAGYLPHLCMEPMTATVWVDGVTASAWAPTQSPQRFALRVARWSGLSVEAVHMQSTLLGGGLGRKGSDYQALRQATELSMSTKQPVQVIWTREDDVRHDQFRPAAGYRLRAGLDADGSILAFDALVTTQSIRRQLFPQWYRPGEHEDVMSYSLHDFKYDVPHRIVASQELDLPVAVGYWRAVGRSNCPFAAESFVDELAALAGADALEYRLRHLGGNSRMRIALEKVAQIAAWGRQLPAGRGLGIAIQDGWDSVCAQVSEVELRDGRIHVVRIWVAADCGLTVNPANVRAQIISGVLDAYTAAMDGGITHANGSAVEGNFDSLPVARMANTPPVEVTLVDSDLPPGGVGELGVPACAPSIANAVFAATGQRVRRLPLNRHLAAVAPG